MKRCTGFTLIESLLVLIILSSVLWILVQFPTQSIQDKIEIEVFTQQLSTLLKKTQQDAILQQQAQRVRFNEKNSTIDFPSTILAIPNGWRIGKNYDFFYYGNGRVEQFETVYIWYNEEKYMTIAFQLGSGQFEIKQ